MIAIPWYRQYFDVLPLLTIYYFLSFNIGYIRSVIYVRVHFLEWIVFFLLLIFLTFECVEVKMEELSVNILENHRKMRI